MATKTAAKVASGVQAKSLRVGNNQVTSTYTLDSSLSAGDVIQMIKVPENATVTYVAINMPLGIGVANVGDGIDTNRYIDLNFSANSTQTVINTNYSPYTYSADDTIDVQISLVSTGGSATSGTISLTAFFTLNP
jgi:hypothetical protein